MQEQIEDMYEVINFLGFNATYHHNYNYVENSKMIFQEVQKFVQWFMDGERFVFEKAVYDNLVDILRDCETAVRNHDHVLMMDALEQGISGYLEMFLSEEFFREKESMYVGRVNAEES